MEEGRSNRPALIFVGFVAIAAAIALGFILLGGGDDGDGGDSAALPEGCQEVEEPQAKEVKLPAPEGKDAEPPPAGSTATVETSCGRFEIELATGDSPKTTASFAYMAEHGAYDGTSINRIAPEFVIQGGDPTETQAGNAGYTVTEPPQQNLMYERGVVAMAKSGAEPPGTSGSQFFVVIAPAVADLPPDYALLGRVDVGFDVVERIASVGTDEIGPAGNGDGPPKEPVVIQRITVGVDTPPA